MIWIIWSTVYLTFGLVFAVINVGSLITPGWEPSVRECSLVGIVGFASLFLWPFVLVYGIVSIIKSRS